MFKRVILLVTCVPLLLVCSGCASFNRIANYPAAGKPTTVAVMPKPMSKMTELPIGAFYDTDRQIIVTGHQKGLFTGMMFGLVGVVVADQMNKSSATRKYGDDSARSATNLVTLTQEIVDQAVADGSAPGWTVAAANAGLRLSPYAIFTLEKSGEAHLYAMLRAEILGADGKPTWSARYFARAPGRHKLDGDDTWMTHERFEPGMRAALQRTIATCIADTHGKLTGATTLTAKGRYPYLNMELELRVIAAQENADSIIGRLAVGDAVVFAGTHVLDRTDYVIKAAKFADPRK